MMVLGESGTGWGRVSEIIDPREQKTIFSIQKFMIDMHLDVDNYVRVVHNIDRNEKVMPHLE